MAENKNKVRHVLHRRSNVSTPKEINIERTTLQVNEPKAPQSTAIEYGEIAVNYGDGNEALFIRNSSDEIVQLNSIKNIRYDGSIDSSLNQYLDERYVNRSGDTIYGDITITAQEGYGDDPKFKYDGSKFEVISDNLNMDIKESSIDSENMILTVKGSSNENCDGSFEFNADNVGIDISCNKGEIISGNSELTINGEYTETVNGSTILVYNDDYKEVITDGNVIKQTIINENGIEESVTGNVENTINGTLTESVTNNVIQNYNKNYTLNVGANNNCNDILAINAQKINIDGNCDINVHSDANINIDTEKVINISGNTTNMKGVLLDVDYENIDLSGKTDIDIISPIVNIDASNYVTISGVNEVQIDSKLVDINGTETTMDGDNLYVTYKNIKMNGTTEIDIDTPIYNLSGSVTNMEGTTLNVDYDNINFEATNVTENYVTLNTTATTNYTEGDTWTINYKNFNLSGKTTNFYGDTFNQEYDIINTTSTTTNNYVDTTNFYGDVNISENLIVSGDTNISGDTIIEGDTNISGDTKIWGDLILNPNKSFDGKLKYPLNFKIATSATKTNSATLIASVDELKYNNSNAENYITEIGSEDPLVTKGYIDDVFENILDDKKITTAIDSFKELQEVLGVTNNGEIKDTTYNTVIEGINAKVNRSGDTMTGTLKIGTDGVTITTSGTINTKSNITSNGSISATNNISTESKFVGDLNNTLSFTSGTFSATSFNNSKGVTVNIPTDISHLSCDKEPSSWTVFDDRYVNVSGDTMSGALTVNGGNITTNFKFVGNLNNTLSFTSGTFSAESFNNNTNVSVKIPTDISHLSCDAEPSSWTVFDKRYVNVTGDTMSGNLTVGTSTTKVTISTNGTIDATGSIYSSDKKLKKNIKSVSNKDIEAVSKIDLKSYKFINDESERERYGVIAQDLEKVGLNNLVVETDNKKGVDYISFLILKIAQLEKRIEELEKR